MVAGCKRSSGPSFFSKQEDRQLLNNAHLHYSSLATAAISISSSRTATSSFLRISILR